MFASNNCLYNCGFAAENCDGCVAMIFSGSAVRSQTMVLKIAFAIACTVLGYFARNLAVT